MEPTPQLLGRIAKPDNRDRRFSIRPLLSRKPLDRQWRYHWANGWWGDQGFSPKCVAYSWLHWTADGPITHSGIKSPVLKPKYLYDQCQLNDEWEGTDYDGTTVRAGAKVMQKKGYIQEYRWAWDAETITRTIIEIAPVVVGTLWTWDMFFPDENNMISCTGEIVGGHAYILNGVNLNRGVVRLKNSWGREWGNNGHVFMKIEDLDKLMKNFGEACLAIPRRK